MAGLVQEGGRHLPDPVVADVQHLQPADLAPARLQAPQRVAREVEGKQAVARQLLGQAGVEAECRVAGDGQVSAVRRVGAAAAVGTAPSDVTHQEMGVGQQVAQGAAPQGGGPGAREVRLGVAVLRQQVVGQSVHQPVEVAVTLQRVVADVQFEVKGQAHSRRRLPPKVDGDVASVQVGEVVVGQDDLPLHLPRNGKVHPVGESGDDVVAEVHTGCLTQHVRPGLEVGQTVVGQADPEKPLQARVERPQLHVADVVVGQVHALQERDVAEEVAVELGQSVERGVERQKRAGQGAGAEVHQRVVRQVHVLQEGHLCQDAGAQRTQLVVRKVHRSQWRQRS